MKEIILLDKNLKKLYPVDQFSSFIWAPKYNDIGDCELVITASNENLKKIRECKYISYSDDEMDCEITKIELKNDEEQGDQLIVTGTDLKDILNQRIVEKQTNFNGYVEDYIRLLINDSIINPTNKDRKIENFILDKKINFKEKIQQQVTYDYVGDKIKELCEQFDLGYKVVIKDGKLVFSLYEGKDRSQYINFSPNFGNLLTSDYVQESGNMKNVALIAGEGEGTARTKITIGSGVGINRKELYVDARDISSKIDYDELKSNYPNGKIVTINNIFYYQVNNVNIAEITYDEKKEVKECILCSDIYIQNLKNKGYDKMTEYVSSESFSGEINSFKNYTYKKDYNLGDVIRISNDYGITIKARITEMIESMDENGYKLSPTFEYLEK